MSKTQMVHSDRVEFEGILSVPLNEWAKYRKSGYEFCNELDRSEVAEINAAAKARSLENRGEVREQQAVEDERRRTEPKGDDNPDGGDDGGAGTGADGGGDPKKTTKKG